MKKLFLLLIFFILAFASTGIASKYCSYSCLFPNSLDDSTPENVQKGLLQNLLNANDFSINVTTNQYQYQVWRDGSLAQTQLRVQYIGKGDASNANVFGYYLDSNVSTFVPLFLVVGDGGQNHSLYPNATVLSIGQNITFNITGNHTIGFAISSDSGSTIRLFSTQNNLNPDGADHAVVFDPCSNTYILGFEDLMSQESDFDYEDLVVKVNILSCIEQKLCGNGIIDNIYPSAGLVGYWKFDEGVGIKAADSSGNGYNGTLVNGTAWTTGIIGGALNFDGINDYVSFPIISSLSGDFAISAWVNSNASGGVRTIVGNNQAGGVILSYEDWVNGIRFGTDGGNFVNWAGVRPPVNEWHQITVVRKNAVNTVELFIDGISKGTKNITGSWTTSNERPRFIGRDYTSNNDFFSGKLDDVRIYNHSLLETEAKSLFDGSLKEECDDGNQNDNDSCRNDCTRNSPCSVGSVFDSGFQKPTDSYMNDQVTNGKRETDDNGNDIDSILCTQTSVNINTDILVNGSRVTRIIYFQWNGSGWLNGLTNNYTINDVKLFSDFNLIQTQFRLQIKKNGTWVDICKVDPQGFGNPNISNCSISNILNLSKFVSSLSDAKNISLRYLTWREDELQPGIQWHTEFSCIKMDVNATCQIIPFCGDGIKDPNEACDDGNKVNGDGCSSECTLDPLRIIAHKIICKNESDLPNWGNGGPQIDGNTAKNFVNSHPGCNFTSDWKFQWGLSNVSNPGDNTGEAGNGWHTFGPTDQNGTASVNISDLQGHPYLWVREVFKDGFIPFTFNLNGQSNINNFSAEFYCYNDVLNYDNFDIVDSPQHGVTYYCVGFNVHKEMERIPIGTCTGQGDLFLYRGNDPFQSVNTSFTVNGNQLLVFVKLSQEPSITAKVNNIITPLSLIANLTSPFSVKVYSVATTPGSNVSINGTLPQNARDLQGYISQNSSSPVYNISTLQVIFDNQQSNTMFLTPGNYSYVFFDKYTFNAKGDISPDFRKLNPVVSGPPGVIINKTYTQPFPVGTQGAVVDSYKINQSGNYTLFLSTEDSIYWPLAKCRQPFCGDGIVQNPNGFGQNEQCDDGNQINTDSCRNNCTLPFCGDGIKDSNEQCDDGNNIDGDGCSSKCKHDASITVCKIIIDPNGNIVNGSQVPGAQFAISGFNPNVTSIGPPVGVIGNSTFTTPLHLNADVLYNDSINDAACIKYSNISLGLYYYDKESLPAQGWEEPLYNDQHTIIVTSLSDFFPYDGRLFDGNESNDAGINDNAEGSITLTEPGCSHCGPNRTLVVLNQYKDFCGNGIIGPHEQCDDGNQNNNDLCNNQCLKTRCGDGIVQSPNGFGQNEQCDDGNQINTDSCRNNCTLPFCGDGIKDSNEACDDGNNINGDGCSSTCEEEKVCIAPIDVMLVVDRSGTMGIKENGSTRLANAKSGSISFVNAMNFTKDKAGLASFNELATLNLNLTSNKPSIINAINALTAGGATDIGDGIKLGRQELVAHGRDNKFMILLSDGAPNVMTLPNGSMKFCFVDPSSPTNCTVYALTQATTTKAADIEIFTIGLGVNNFTESLLKNIATVPTNYFFAPNSTVLGSIYSEITGEICGTAFCGDGVVDENEQCDDGNQNNNDGCRNNCKLPLCGDGITDVSEQCDDANQINSDLCKNDCTFTFCGDSIVQHPNGQGTKGPNNDGFESCDDGNQIEADQCTNLCTLTFCGDGIIQVPNGLGQNEECDDQNSIDGDGCSHKCKLEVCGNGRLDFGEECDDGNLANGDGCSSICKTEQPVCGNGKVEQGEQCDDGNQINTDSCRNNCTLPICGDGIKDPNEQCDDGANNNLTNGCTNVCTLTFCGDGIIQHPNGLGLNEQCDDGNVFDNDGCNQRCQNEPQCGNGIIEQGEQCDDGNNINGDGCSSTCEEEKVCIAPIDVMLVVDRSGTMGIKENGSTRLANAKSGSISFVNAMNFTKDKAGLASFNELATLNLNLTSNKPSIINAINALTAGGATDIGDGIKLGRQELVAHGRDNKFMILLSDGAPNVMTLPNGSMKFCFVDPSSPTNCTVYALTQATTTKAADIEIFTIGLGVNNFTESLLKNIATVPTNYFFAPNSTVLGSIYSEITGEICGT